MDNNGQLSLEYLLIFFVSIIILSIISIPLVYDTMDNINDIKKTVEVKNSLTEIANNVHIIYSTDYCTKKTVPIQIHDNMTIYCNNASKNNNYYIYSYVKLSDNSSKKVIVQVPTKVSFKGNSKYYYNKLYERWYYNTEFKWIKSSTGNYNIDIYFK